MKNYNSIPRAVICQQFEKPRSPGKISRNTKTLTKLNQEEINDQNRTEQSFPLKLNK